MNKKMNRWVGLWLGLGNVLAFQQAQAADEAPARELVVIDLRPQEEKDGLGLIPLTGKCNKDVSRIADVASDPMKVEVLRAALAEQLGLASEGKTLTVLNWSIYYNEQNPSGGSRMKSVGIQGFNIPTKSKEPKVGSKCSQKESAGGWFERKDVTTGWPPLVSEFAGMYGGKPFNVRVVHSVHREIEGKFEGGARDTEDLMETVGQTAEALAAAIVQ
jgi:hypothetical protein